MTTVLSIGGATCEVKVDVEYNVHNSQCLIIGRVRAANVGLALANAKRKRTKFPDAKFVTRVRDE